MWIYTLDLLTKNLCNGLIDDANVKNSVSLSLSLYHLRNKMMGWMILWQHIHIGVFCEIDTGGNRYTLYVTRG